MNPTIKGSILLSLLLLIVYSDLKAQQEASYSLQQLIDSAVSRSYLIALKNWQIQEKMSKLKEDGIKRYPSVVLGGNYQHNFSLAELNIPAGIIGTIPTTSGSQLLPEKNTPLNIGQHTNYSADVSLYQPILQQVKIKTGLEIDKTDIRLSEAEKTTVIRQLTLTVQKLYYGILIAQKQMDEASAKLAMAQAKLADAKSALDAGKVIPSNLSGLHASVAEEEQNVLKLDILMQDYKRELASVTNLNTNEDILLQPLDTTAIAIDSIEPVDSYQRMIAANSDLQIAKLNREKALLAIKAARQSNLPDIGLTGGYYYQRGNPLLPTSSPYIGINLKWNLQDIFSNHHVQRQREAQLKQAELNVSYQQQQLRTDIDKAHHKVIQTRALRDVAKKALLYRMAEFKVQQHKQISGLDIKSNMLEVKASLAKAEADFYAAQLSHLVAMAELRNLAGQ